MPATPLKAENASQTQQLIQKAAEILNSGGLVVFPTETVYGVAASAGSIVGLSALRSLKNRPHHPFSVHLPDPAAAERYADTSSPMLKRLIRKTMPGPVTVVVDVDKDVIESKLRSLDLPPEVGPRLYHQNTVGLRCPDHDLARRILASIPDPLVASSANRHDQPAPINAEEATTAVGDAVHMIVDGGRCRFAKASTIVRVRGLCGQIKIAVDRPGVYDARYMQKLMRWTMLLVCSGNTCRSPMAEGLGKQILAARRGLISEDLEVAGIRVLSAGTFAMPGAAATPEAIQAMKKYRIDVSGHRAQILSAELVHEADVIYCMTETHRRAVLDKVPSATDKTHLLDPTGDICDPIGTGSTGYQRSAELIRRRLEQRLNEQQL